MAVGEEVLPFFWTRARWTISDESVLARSVSGATARPRRSMVAGLAGAALPPLQTGPGV